MKKYFTIARSIIFFGIVTALALFVVIGTSLYSLGQLRVGGPLYERIILGKDLVADILPPPEYVIESYLEATLALRDPASVEARSRRLNQLKKEYDDRHDYWLKTEFDPSVKDLLTDVSHREVEKFWTAIEKDLLPALAKGDTETASKAYSVVSAAYAAHRQAVDRIVKLANDGNAATEIAAAGRVESMTLLLWAVSALVFLIIGGGIVGVGLGVIRPIIGMTGSMRKLADGDLDGIIPGVSRTDEIGAMGRAVLVFKESMIRAKQLAEKDAEAVADRMARAARVSDLAQNFDTSVSGMLDSFMKASTGLQTTLASMKTMADQTTSQAVSAASTAQQTSTNVQTVAAASEELANSVTEIGRQVTQSARMAKNAVDEADRTNSTIQTLSGEAAKIGDVVDLINEIASQTNLLALNATIEAARAGDSGKGFAVVAAEVKSLAEQTAKATDQISTQIKSIQSSSSEAVNAVQLIGTVIGEMNAIATAIASAVEEQAAATQEIARNIQQAAIGTNDISRNVTDVQGIAGHTGTATEQVILASQELSEQSRVMRSEVVTFLADIKAA